MDYEITVPIEAAPHVVWSLVADVERWQEWTPSVRRVRRLDAGDLRRGSRAEVDQPRLPTTVWEVTEVEPGRSFTWTSSSGGVTTMGRHVVESAAGGSTLTLALRQAGALAGLAGLLFGRRSHRYVDQEAEGFRRAAELAASS